MEKQKLMAISMVHLYALHIKNKQEHINQVHEVDNNELAKAPQALQSIRHKLQRNSLGVFLIKEFILHKNHKSTLKRF